MIKIHKLLFISMFLTLLTSGCASVAVEDVNARIQSWNGQPIEELIKFWGLPNKQSQVGDNQYAEWVNREREQGNTSFSIGTGSRSRNAGVGVGVTLNDLGGSDLACSRLVTYNSEGKVTKIQWQGEPDYCYKLTPDLAKVQANQR